MAITIDNGIITADGGVLMPNGPTLGDMKAEIANELARSDLTGEIASAITKAIRRYQAQRLGFAEGSFVFSTTAGQSTYGGPTNVNIQLVRKIDTVMVAGPVTPYEVRQRRSDELEVWDTTFAPAQPAYFSYFGEQIRFYPAPDAAYSIRVRGHMQAPPPANDSVSNYWTNEAGDLIAARAKWYLAVHVLRDRELKADMEIAMADALNELIGRLARVSSTGQVAAYDL